MNKLTVLRCGLSNTLLGYAFACIYTELALSPYSNHTTELVELYMYTVDNNKTHLQLT